MKPVGKDPEFRYAISLAEKLSKEKRPLILVGETGTGKSFLARYIHEKSGSPDEPFIEWHAGSVPESLIESEILGVDKGIATGVLPRTGVFEAVGGGTLCISGIEEIAPHTQAIFLRLIESGEFEKIGGQRKVPFRGRVIAAFQEDPQKLARDGKLRTDLLYRLDVFRIDLPPLRERKGDIRGFVSLFLGAECRRAKRKAPGIGKELMKYLENYGWPGNIRELENVVLQMAREETEMLGIGHLPPQFLFPKEGFVERASDERLNLCELKRRYIASVLQRTGGRKTEAAKWLGISRKSLWEHLKEEKE